MSDGIKSCLAVVQKLKKNPNAYPFLYPVDKNLVPDYYEKILDPMDLSKVEKNLRDGVYSSTLEFASDVRKIWNNAFIYNDERSEIFHMTKEMSIYFEELFKDVENMALPVNSNNIEQLQRQIEQLTGLSKKLLESNAQTSYVRSPVASVSSHRVSKSPLDKPMTLEEKRQLGAMIRDLPQEYLRGVFQIVSDALPDSGANNEVLEFDLDLLPVRKVRELERYVKAKVKLTKQSQAKKKGSNKRGQVEKCTLR